MPRDDDQPRLVLTDGWKLIDRTVHGRNRVEETYRGPHGATCRLVDTWSDAGHWKVDACSTRHVTYRPGDGVGVVAVTLMNPTDHPTRDGAVIRPSGMFRLDTGRLERLHGRARVRVDGWNRRRNPRMDAPIVDWTVCVDNWPADGGEPSVRLIADWGRPPLPPVLPWRWRAWWLARRRELRHRLDSVPLPGLEEAGDESMTGVDGKEAGR